MLLPGTWEPIIVVLCTSTKNSIKSIPSETLTQKCASSTIYARKGPDDYRLQAKPANEAGGAHLPRLYKHLDSSFVPDQSACLLCTSMPTKLVDHARPSASSCTSSRIASTVLQAFKLLPKTGKPQSHEHTVLAGISRTRPRWDGPVTRDSHTQQCMQALWSLEVCSRQTPVRLLHSALVQSALVPRSAHVRCSFAARAAKALCVQVLTASFISLHV